MLVDCSCELTSTVLYGTILKSFSLIAVEPSKRPSSVPRVRHQQQRARRIHASYPAVRLDSSSSTSLIAAKLGL